MNCRKNSCSLRTNNKKTQDQWKTKEINKLRFEYPAFLKLDTNKIIETTKNENQSINQLFFLNDHVNQRCVNKHGII